jgi:hypothetical protein
MTRCSIGGATLLALRNDARADDARSRHAAVFLMRADANIGAPNRTPIRRPGPAQAAIAPIAK